MKMNKIAFTYAVSGSARKVYISTCRYIKDLVDRLMAEWPYALGIRVHGQTGYTLSIRVLPAEEKQ